MDESPNVYFWYFNYFLVTKSTCMPAASRCRFRRRNRRSRPAHWWCFSSTNFATKCCRCRQPWPTADTRLHQSTFPCCSHALRCWRRRTGGLGTARGQGDRTWHWPKWVCRVPRQLARSCTRRPNIDTSQRERRGEPTFYDTAYSKKAPIELL